MEQTINIKKIFDNIEYHLKKADDFGYLGGYDFAAKNEAKAEVLIQLVESWSCGSIGGYDKEDPKCGKHGDLWSRFKWLLKKHKVGLKSPK